MRVTFRADASSVIGHGHVVRCMALANELRARGATVDFVTREADGDLAGFLEAQGISVRRLPRRAGSEPVETLDARWSDDADETAAAIAGFSAPPDWLVVDSYALDHRWEQRLRSSVGQILAIDDLANRPHDCDVLLDQNLVADMESRYDAMVPRGCDLLLGPKYALLDGVYAALHHRSRVRSGPVRRLFIFFGGADRSNLAGRSLSAYLSVSPPEIELDIIVPSSAPQASEIRRQAAGQRGVTVHTGMPTLAPLMAEADAALGAGGSTTWERLCVGLPSLVITLAPNQESVASELHRRGLVRLIGKNDDIDDAIIEVALRELIEQPLDRAWSERCREVVDGRGAARMADRLFRRR